MINIIMFSLLMMFFKTGDASVDDYSWITEEGVLAQYKKLQTNIAKRGIYAKKSIMLQACSRLCDCFPNVDWELQAEIYLILNLLCEKSVKNIDALVQNLISEDDKVNACQTTVFESLLRCVYKVKSQFSASSAPEYRMSGEIMTRLETVFCGRTGLVNPPVLQDDDWLTSESIPKIYTILENNLQNGGIMCENSTMLQACRTLADSCQGAITATAFLLQVDVGTILYALAKKSVENATALAETFREEDKKVAKDTVKKSDALGRCVPVVDDDKLRKALRWLDKDKVKKSDALDRYVPVVNGDEKSLRYCGIEQDSDRIESIAKRYKKQNAARFVREVIQILDAPPMPDDVTHAPPMHISHLKMEDVRISQQKYNHYLYCMLRGVNPIDNPSAPNYIYYAWAGQTVDILEELPAMLTRIQGMVKMLPGYEAIASVENARARLQRIMLFMPGMSGFEKAILFAWAFVLERMPQQCDILGLHTAPSIAHIWETCVKEVPKYLYVLTKCTNIEVYGGCMRSPRAEESHTDAAVHNYVNCFDENRQSFSLKWQGFMGLRNHKEISAIAQLFTNIFKQREPLHSSHIEMREVTISREQYQHYLHYMLRGVKPSDNPSAPNYIYYAATGQQVDILKEFPTMITRIKDMVRVPLGCDGIASVKNAHARLDSIMKGYSDLPRLQKAILFAWAFVMERQRKAYYFLGFFSHYHSISHIWKQCMIELPKYLYVLEECTNMHVYGGSVRNSDTYRKHIEAHARNCVAMPEENGDSYNFEWNQSVGFTDDDNFVDSANSLLNNLFKRLLPSGDAEGAVW